MTWGYTEQQIVGGVVVLATLAAGLVAVTGLHDAQAAALRSPYLLNGHLVVYPPIGSDQRSRACQVFRAYADSTAFAFSKADRRAPA
jgi:hypothetical protein